MKKVLILTASTGEGHNTAAKSLEDKYKESGFETYRVDIFKETSTSINTMISEGYRIMANRFPAIYGMIYDTLDRKSFNNRVLGTVLFIIKQRILKIVKEIDPDIIVATHPFAVGMISSLKKKGKINASFISVVTDFKAHWAYVDQYVDAYITGSEYTKESLVERNIPEGKVFTYGIPIKKEFLSHSSDHEKAEIDMDKYCLSECLYREFCEEKLNNDICPKAAEMLGVLDWKENGFRFKVLVMGGSMGSKDIASVVSHLAVNSDKYEITVVCGNNKPLKSMLEKRYGEAISSEKLIIYGFTDKIPALMDECDVIITKPGGLTTSEAIAKNIPMIVPFAIPGQESENTEFLVNAGVAIHVKNMKEIDEYLEYLIENKDIYLDMKRKMRNISKSYSLDKIVDLSKSLITGNILPDSIEHC
jgi:processive 1,2-diacylglycerol beta-glucosyltransferase